MNFIKYIYIILLFRLKDCTFSFWGYVEEHKKEFLNPLYSIQAETIVPDLSPQNIRFWRGMYCRFENGVHPREHVFDILLATSEQTKSLDDHIKFLQKRLSYFKRKISDGADMVKNSLFSKETCLEPMSYNKEENNIQSLNETFDNLTVTIPKLDESHKIAIEWKSLREAVSCECSTDSSSKKVIIINILYFISYYRNMFILYFAYSITVGNVEMCFALVV